MNWKQFAQEILDGRVATRDEALAVLNSKDNELLEVLHASFILREAHWGRGVRLHVLQNAKSGICRENCAFCSQAIGAYSGVDRYQMQSIDELVEGAREAYKQKAVKYCMVTATRGPSDAELSNICEATKQIKQEMPITICASLGLLNDEQAKTLAEAGVDRFNHNLETSSSYYPEVCQTHTWEDRKETIAAVKRAGMEACCGGIMGMGEQLEDRVDLALSLQALSVESIPVNFLDPRPGTPLGHLEQLSPNDCLRSLAMFRFTNPASEVRCAGGREVCLKHLQVLALYPANSMFTEGYLTTDGARHCDDISMIEEAGFFVEQLVEEPVAPRSCAPMDS
jgi:biotin synthase